MATTQIKYVGALVAEYGPLDYGSPPAGWPGGEPWPPFDPVDTLVIYITPENNVGFELLCTLDPPTMIESHDGWEYTGGDPATAEVTVDGETFANADAAQVYNSAYRAVGGNRLMVPVGTVVSGTGWSQFWEFDGSGWLLEDPK
jgi:hypothetical protein